MNDVGKFLRNHGSNILTVVIGFFTLLTLFSMLGINFNPSLNKQVQKVVTIESLENNDNGNGNGNGNGNSADTGALGSIDQPNSICKSTDIHAIHQDCTKLTNNNCTSVSCCVLLNGNKCVGGNKFGPTYHSEDGKDHDINYYKYKGGCRGNCPTN